MIILQDTREQTPLQFPKNIEVCKATLQTGDYSICFEEEARAKYTDEDLNHLVCIERKSCPSEIASNITTKRWKGELERIAKFQHKFLLMEFSFQDVLNFPIGSSIPRSRWKYLRVKPKFIISCLMSYPIQYGIQPIFAGDADNAAYIATSILKAVYKSIEG